MRHAAEGVNRYLLDLVKKYVCYFPCFPTDNGSGKQLAGKSLQTGLQQRNYAQQPGKVVR
jgi:hypothetical protein